MSKDVLQYKGYIAKVEFDRERQLLCGTVQGIRDAVNFESADPAGLEAAFHDSVDRYLSFCEAVGRRSCQPFNGQFSVRIGHKLHQDIAEWALANGMKLNEAMKLAVQEFLAQKEQA